MHDWTLQKIDVEWATGTAIIEMTDLSSIRRTVKATNMINITIPRKCPWGESVSINEAIYKVDEANEMHTLIIQMQSGDQITVEAQFISEARVTTSAL